MKSARGASSNKVLVGATLVWAGAAVRAGRQTRATVAARIRASARSTGAGRNSSESATRRRVRRPGRRNIAPG